MSRLFLSPYTLHTGKLKAGTALKLCSLLRGDVEIKSVEWNHRLCVLKSLEIASNFVLSTITPIQLMIELCIPEHEYRDLEGAMRRSATIPLVQQLRALIKDSLFMTLLRDDVATDQDILRFQSVLEMFIEKRFELENIAVPQWNSGQLALSFMMYTANEMMNRHDGNEDDTNWEHDPTVPDTMWLFIHFLRRFCIETKMNGIELNDFWIENMVNGAKMKMFGEVLADRVCSHFKCDVDQFSSSMEMLSFWFIEELRRFRKHPVVLDQCSVEDIVILFTFKADDDADEKERNSDREEVDGVFCRFEKRDGNDADSILEVVEWKEKIVEWIRSDNMDGKKMMETDNEQLIEGMKRALNVGSDDDESLDNALVVILDLCRQSAVDEILERIQVIRERGVICKMDGVSYRLFVVNIDPFTFPICIVPFSQHWTAEKIKSEIHTEGTNVNWALFAPSDKELIVLEYGHGGTDVVCEHLKWRKNEVVYGLMRFTFDFVNESKISKWLFFVWYESLYLYVDLSMFCPLLWSLSQGTRYDEEQEGEEGNERA